MFITRSTSSKSSWLASKPKCLTKLSKAKCLKQLSIKTRIRKQKSSEDNEQWTPVDCRVDFAKTANIKAKNWPEKASSMSWSHSSEATLKNRMSVPVASATVLASGDSAIILEPLLAYFHVRNKYGSWFFLYSTTRCKNKKKTDQLLIAQKNQRNIRYLWRQILQQERNGQEDDKKVSLNIICWAMITQFSPI